MVLHGGPYLTNHFKNNTENSQTHDKNHDFGIVEISLMMMFFRERMENDFDHLFLMLKYPYQECVPGGNAP